MLMQDFSRLAYRLSDCGSGKPPTPEAAKSIQYP